MRALHLDLRRRRPSWPAWALLAVGLALAADAAVTYVQADEKLAQLQRRRAGPQIGSTATKQAPSESLQRELDAARQVLQELALPWEPLFRAIEGAGGGDTALLAIEPDAGKRLVRISGEARNYPAVLRFMQRLEAEQVLGGVHLLNHQVREDSAERPYQFTLSAGWRATP